MTRALLADDEPLLLEEMRDLLVEAWPELEIVATARTGAEALQRLSECAPHVAFLDIEMPRMNGLEVAAAESGTRIVFVTAHERHAVAAFERGAADYLLKPVTPARLAISVRRLKRLLSSSAEQGSGGVLRFVQAWRGNTMHVVPIDEVIAFVSDDKYTRVVSLRGELHLRRSLTELAKELDGAVFWSVARGTVIHARYIEKVERSELGEIRVRMAHMDSPLAIGRSHRDRFRGM